MTDFTFDRSFDTEGTSSVIDEVFYNSDTKQLIVQLIRRNWRGDVILAGYEDVPLNVYTSMESLNKNRVENGDETQSVGYYWNSWIKPFFKGFDTAGLVPVSAKQPDEDDLVAQAPAVEDVSTSEVVETEQDVEVSAFTIHFNADDLEDGNEFILWATDVNEALVLFGQIADLARWEAVQIVAVTYHYV